MAMTLSQAETFAAQVLDWLAGDHARIGAFLSASGTTPADLRAGAGEPALMLAIVEFLMADEAMLLECCAALGVSPEYPARARAAMPGGDDVHWT